MNIQGMRRLLAQSCMLLSVSRWRSSLYQRACFSFGNVLWSQESNHECKVNKIYAGINKSAHSAFFFQCSERGTINKIKPFKGGLPDICVL